jgi:2-succinyl-6-hydroxy-2,4-cyclohexadiene-1-carboxylate synthase
MGSKDDWTPLVEQLDDRPIVTVDLPGHGESLNGHDDDYTMLGAARALDSTLADLRIDSCDLLGYSMGGRLALFYAISFPERLHTLILESSSPGLDTEQERSDRVAHDERLAERLETEDFTDFLTAWYDQPLFASLSRDPDWRARLIQRRRANDPRELARALRGMSTGRQPSLWERLPELTIPVQLMAGELDSKYTTLGTLMHGLCPHADLRIMNTCGHNVHVEDPGGFAREVQGFLNKHR